MNVLVSSMLTVMKIEDAELRAWFELYRLCLDWYQVQSMVKEVVKDEFDVRRIFEKVMSKEDY